MMDLQKELSHVDVDEADVGAEGVVLGQEAQASLFTHADQLRGSHAFHADDRLTEGAVVAGVIGAAGDARSSGIADADVDRACAVATFCVNSLEPLP